MDFIKTVSPWIDRQFDRYLVNIKFFNLMWLESLKNIAFCNQFYGICIKLRSFLVKLPLHFCNSFCFYENKLIAPTSQLVGKS